VVAFGYWWISARSLLSTPALWARPSSRWRAAADVGAAVSDRAAAPDESTAQAASAVRVAADMFVVIRARIGGGSFRCDARAGPRRWGLGDARAAGAAGGACGTSGSAGPDEASGGAALCGALPWSGLPRVCATWPRKTI